MNAHTRILERKPAPHRAANDRIDLYAALDAADRAKARRQDFIEFAVMLAAVCFIVLLIVTGGAL